MVYGYDGEGVYISLIHSNKHLWWPSSSYLELHPKMHTSLYFVHGYNTALPLPSSLILPTKMEDIVYSLQWHRVFPELFCQIKSLPALILHPLVSETRKPYETGYSGAFSFPKF